MVDGVSLAVRVALSWTADCISNYAEKEGQGEEVQVENQSWSGCREEHNAQNTTSPYASPPGKLPTDTIRTVLLGLLNALYVTSGWSLGCSFLSRKFDIVA